MTYFHPSFYYVRYRLLLRCLREMFRQPATARMLLMTIFILLLYMLHQIVHLFFRVLDEVFYFRHRSVMVKAPVFIVANPRSGTTYLHRLMSFDEDRFSYMKLAHTLFPTASFVNLAHVLKKIDKHTGNGMRWVVNKIDELAYGGWTDMHAMGFNKAEEDEAVFAMPLYSPGLFILFPYIHLIKDNHFLDHEPQDVRSKVMAFYKSSVKRFLHGSRSSKTYLAKNVMSSGRLRSLLKTFPDARIIYIARHPYEAVPSCANMFSAMYNFHSPRMPGTHPAKRAWCELSIDFYRYFHEVKKEIPVSQRVQLRYEDLIANPKETVLNIYAHFGWQPSEKFLKQLDEAAARNRHYRSLHNYSLQQFGYSEEEVYERLFEEMNELGFERTPTPTPAQSPV